MISLYSGVELATAIYCSPILQRDGVIVTLLYGVHVGCCADKVAKKKCPLRSDLIYTQPVSTLSLHNSKIMSSSLKLLEVVMPVLGPRINMSIS